MNVSVSGDEFAALAKLLYQVMPTLHLWTIALALYMIRFVVVLTILPVTAEGVLNNLSRMGLALLLAFYVAYGRPLAELGALGPGEFALIALKEAVIGVALGFAMSTVFWVVEYAGALIDTAAGFNSVQLQNPMSQEQSTPVSNMMMKLAGAVFFAIGGGLFAVQALFESFEAWPLADLRPSLQGAYAVFIERQVGTLFGSTLKLAAPVLVILVLIDLGIGLLSRSAEKLEPANLAQPLKGIITIVLLVLMVSAAFEPLRTHLLPHGIVKQLLPDRGASAPQR